jgi:L-fuculose-phosphate aldolase
LSELRRQLIDGARRMGAVGLNRGTAGNLSVRLGGRRERGAGFLITPSGMPYALALSRRHRLHASRRNVRGRRRPSSEWRFPP